MDNDLRRQLLALELDIVALEVDLHLQVVRALPLPPTSSPVITWTNLWLCHMLPAIVPRAPIAIIGESAADLLHSTCSPSTRAISTEHVAG